MFQVQFVRVQNCASASASAVPERHLDLTETELKYFSLKFEKIFIHNSKLVNYRKIFCLILSSLLFPSIIDIDKVLECCLFI